MPQNNATTGERQMIRPTWRIYLATGAFGGLLVGLQAACIDVAAEMRSGQVDVVAERWYMIYFIFGPVVGMVMGLLATPFVVWATVRKDLRVVAPVLVIGTATIDLSVSFALQTSVREQWGFIFHVLVSSSALAILTAIVAVSLPNRFGPFRGKTCQRCGYDLTGNRTARCPECGRPIPIDAVF